MVPDQQTVNHEELLALDAAAERLCVSKTTLYRMLDRGEVKGIKVGRQWRFRLADLDTYLTRGPVAVALAAVPVEVVDREIEIISGKLAALQASVPEVIDDNLDPWELRILQLLLGLVKLARVRNASDVHFEVMRDDGDPFVLVRFRIDGSLHEIHRLPVRVYEALALRVRIMATGEAGGTGQFNASLHLSIDGGIEDVRAGLLTGFLGDMLTIHLLSAASLSPLRLDDLGFHPDDFARVRGWMAEPQGLILIAGPTRCGKTTLGYRLVQEIAGAHRKIVTIENPVEQQLRWCTQIDLSRTRGSSGDALRGIMRQDVDAIMLSALDTLETLDLAVHAAVVGYLVIAPVHVMTPIDALPRFVSVFPEMQQPSITAYLGAAVRGIIGVRLLRRLCPECKQPVTLSDALRNRLRAIGLWSDYHLPADAQFFQAAGCEACSQSGYRGRMGIYEVVEMTPVLRDAFLAGASHDGVIHATRGTRTLIAEGIRNAAEGLTSAEEILPLLRQYERALQQVTTA